VAEIENRKAFITEQNCDYFKVCLMCNFRGKNDKKNICFKSSSLIHHLVDRDMAVSSLVQLVLLANLKLLVVGVSPPSFDNSARLN
jgi:hypothetical protein